VRIEDTGMALTKDEANSLFDPFSSATFKASRKSGGAGVRLSTAARLIAMMDGEVEVESSKGHGVVFNFYLHLGYADPGTKPIETTSLEDTISQDKVDLRHLKIMVVEDNLTNSSLLKWILEDLEHEVEVAENGVECLNMLESKDYDLIFMDQHMPEMDGEEATRRIRERQDHKANIPIIGCTADAFQETRDLLTSAGQNDVISKPISNDIVFEVTQKFLSGSYKPVAEPKQDKV
jgi:CheY-like chemotaxis protein